MPEQTPSQISSKRVAKNTLLLYMRTFITMLVSLYTSRITLQALGVDNYGIQNAVGGAIAMFNIISGSMSSSISRYITFELGRGDKSRLNRIFCTAMNLWRQQTGCSNALCSRFPSVWLLFPTMRASSDMRR